MQTRYKRYKKTYQKYQKKWQEENRVKVREYNTNTWDKNNFGGLREFVFERDNYACRNCGMTNEQHILNFGRSLTIDHIDGKGVNVSKEEKNNDPNNLITLCFRCHGRKDALRRWSKIE